MRVVFSMRNLWYIRIFESVIRELAGRGHQVHIASDGGRGKERAREWNEAAEALVRQTPNVTLGWVPQPVNDDWVDLRITVHLALDYLRFLEPEYATAPALRERARQRTPQWMVRAAALPILGSRAGRAVMAAMLRLVERALPFDPALAEYIANEQPDVVLITPLLTLGSEQQDVLRVARSLGKPTVLCVGSWDHLSSKALVREQPDRVLVWNDTQRSEAVELHGLPSSSVVVTGAQCFDQWFTRQPTRTREEFCREVGLDPARPYVLYVCSALFEGSPSEAGFVRQWSAAVRASDDPVLSRAGIVVRQHPKRGFEWDHVDLTGIPDAVLWPPKATAPFRDASKDDYFDSMFHSAAVVGLNTSALIEAGIVGRRVHTMLLPQFQENQEGTIHFRYLLDQGLLQTARDLAGHLQQLAVSVRSADPAVHHNRAFVERFVRPRGLTNAATPVFCDAVEAAGGVAVAKVAEPFWAGAARVALAPLARATRDTMAKQINRERRRHEKEAERRTEREAAAARRAERKRLELELRRARVEELRAERMLKKRQQRDTKLSARDERLTAWRRQKQRARFQERVRRYVRVITRPFSAGR